MKKEFTTDIEEARRKVKGYFATLYPNEKYEEKNILSNIDSSMTRLLRKCDEAEKRSIPIDSILYMRELISRMYSVVPVIKESEASCIEYKCTNGAWASISMLRGLGVIVFYTADEVRGGFTYPFTGFDTNNLWMIPSLGCYIFKPTREISIEEAQTFEGYKAIDEFLGFSDVILPDEELKENFSGNEYIGEFTDAIIDEARENSPIQFEHILELTGRGGKVRSGVELCEAIEKLYGGKLTESQTSSIGGLYYYKRGEDFLNYCLYEFLRTEDYNHLQRILSKYESFGLPKEWDKFTFLEGTTPEKYILRNYVKHDIVRFIGEIDFERIAKYTNTPLNVLLSAIK